MGKVDFAGRVVVVTGAGNGLGRNHALAFAARGARVVVNDLGGSINGEGKSTSVAQKVVDEIRGLGGEAIANIDSVEDGARIVDCAMDTYGRIDVVINNAGILRDAAFHKMTESDWDLVYRTHLLGAFRVTRAAWPFMRTAGYGRIVMTASAAGIYGNFGQANYAAAKLALHGFAQTLAVEGASRGITANTIAPMAASRMTETVLAPEMLNALKPEYITPLVLWLSHHDCEARGEIFEAGGGWIAKLRWERASGAIFTGQAAPTPDDVRNAWSKIQDFRDSERPKTVSDAFAPLARATGIDMAVQRQ